MGAVLDFLFARPTFLLNNWQKAALDNSVFSFEAYGREDKGLFESFFRMRITIVTMNSRLYRI